MLEAPTLDYFTQSEAARELGWSRQKVWMRILTKDIACFHTLGSRPIVLIHASEVERQQRAQGKKGKR